jgi:hypothetical protein
MPAALINVAVYDPRSKRTRTRSFSWGGRTGRTEDEARKMAGEWEAAQRAELAGVARGPYGRPRGGKKAAESVNQLAAPSDPILAIPPPMPRQPLRLQLPEGASTLALVGSSRSGKTTLAIKLISDYYAKRLCVLFSVNQHAAIYSGLPRGFLRASDFYPSVVKAIHKINKISGNKWPFLVYLQVVGLFFLARSLNSVRGQPDRHTNSATSRTGVGWHLARSFPARREHPTQFCFRSRTTNIILQVFCHHHQGSVQPLHFTRKSLLWTVSRETASHPSHQSI